MKHPDLPSVRARLANLPPAQKQFIMVPIDAVLIAFSLWASLAIRLETLTPSTLRGTGFWLLVLMPLLGLAIFRQFGIYRVTLRFMGSRGAFRIGRATIVIALTLSAIAHFFPNVFIPRSTPIIFGLLLCGLLLSTRMVVKEVYNWVLQQGIMKTPVLIYGAGASGTQLAASLDAAREFRVISFIDDDEKLRGRLVAGHRVCSPDQLDDLVRKFKVTDILLALPSVSRSRRREILLFLSDRRVRVRTIPSMTEILAGFASIDKLRDVNVDELLGRDVVDPMDKLFETVRDKCVLVTGAGGSIGAELCRQAAAHGARKIVLYEISEFALYQIENELRSEWAGPALALRPILGSINDEDLLTATLRENKVDTIFHAAAYKHVPLVEANPIEGARNNILGTLSVARAACAAGVSHAVLISTDKAVRPTNVMGASKRLAERVFIDCQRDTAATTFCMVRFGNVMESSGSVIPLFKKQIAAGGPVTVTHPQVTRYFMTIPEAAQLVIQASSMSTGGDVFLLDMGSSVSILDLARRMIHLSGANIKSKEHPEGEIEIVFTGLRPGEKLFEELLIEAEAAPTRHPKIFRAVDGDDGLAIGPVLDELRAAIADRDRHKLVETLRNTVEGFRAEAKDVDEITIR